MSPRPRIFIAAALVAVLCATALAGCSGPSGVPFWKTTRHQPFTALDWDALAAHPDTYAGVPVKFVGKVFVPFNSVSEPPNIQVFVHPQDASGVAVVAVAGDPGVKYGDYVAIEGTVVGEFTGVSSFSKSGVTAVLIHATSVEPTASTGAATPAE